jgi:hypothetical protein
MLGCPGKFYRWPSTSPCPAANRTLSRLWGLLLKVLSAAGFSRDFLYKDSSQYVLLRYWKSEEARGAAYEDPEVQRCWAKLGNEIRILKVFEVLEKVELS